MNHRISPREAFGLAAITALSLGLSPQAAPESTPADPLATERTIVASRYAGCAITKVIHDNSHPVRENGKLRDKLHLELSLTDKPEAAAIMERYEDNDTV